MSTAITELFGTNVFSVSVMRERLPKGVCRSDQCDGEWRSISMSTADVVANAMKNWALEKGATHYTHWFQPLTGITAEKHDSFLTAPVGGQDPAPAVGQAADPGGAGRLLLPLRRPAGHL